MQTANAVVVYSQKLQFVANAAAQAHNERHFWLGAFRPDWDQAKANERATRVAGELLDKLQLPPLTCVNFSNRHRPQSPLSCHNYAHRRKAISQHKRRINQRPSKERDYPSSIPPR